MTIRKRSHFLTVGTYQTNKTAVFAERNVQPGPQPKRIGHLARDRLIRSYPTLAQIHNLDETFAAQQRLMPRLGRIRHLERRGHAGGIATRCDTSEVCSVERQ